MPEASVKSEIETRHEDRRWLLFALIVTAITEAMTSVIVLTWNFFTHTKLSALELIFPGMTLAFIIAIMLSPRAATAPVRALYHSMAIWTGFASFALFGSLGAWVAFGITAILPVKVPREDIGYAVFAIVSAMTVWALIRARWLVTTVVNIKLTPPVPPSWRGRTAALITDLHLGNIQRAPFLQRIVTHLEASRPDIIFISGDLFDDTQTDYDALLAPWKKLSPPLGTFYVTGNHEEFTQREKFFGPITRAGIRVLNNEKIDIDGLQLIGLHDTEATNPKIFRSIMDRLGINRQRASILLAHQPKAAKTALEYGISLQLSGHTHGGQSWPWTLVARRVHGAANYGLSQLGDMLLYTSSGAGTWGPPMRLGSKSELVTLKFN